MTIVTASVDRIDRLGTIDVSQDLKLVGPLPCLSFHYVALYLMFCPIFFSIRYFISLIFCLISSRFDLPRSTFSFDVLSLVLW